MKPVHRLLRWSSGVQSTLEGNSAPYRVLLVRFFMLPVVIYESPAPCSHIRNPSAAPQSSRWKANGHPYTTNTAVACCSPEADSHAVTLVQLLREPPRSVSELDKDQPQLPTLPGPHNKQKT